MRRSTRVSVTRGCSNIRAMAEKVITASIGEGDSSADVIHLMESIIALTRTAEKYASPVNQAGVSAALARHDAQMGGVHA